MHFLFIENLLGLVGGADLTKHKDPYLASMQLNPKIELTLLGWEQLFYIKLQYMSWFHRPFKHRQNCSIET